MYLQTNFWITVMKKTSYDLECRPSRYDLERNPSLSETRRGWKFGLTPLPSSDQRLIKWFGKTFRIFDLGLYLNWAMPTSPPASNIVLTPLCHESCISYLLSKTHKICTKWWPFSMSSKITQVNIWGIFNTTKVGNACFVIAQQRV